CDPRPVRAGAWEAQPSLRPSAVRSWAPAWPRGRASAWLLAERSARAARADPTSEAAKDSRPVLWAATDSPRAWPAKGRALSMGSWPARDRCEATRKEEGSKGSSTWDLPFRNAEASNSPGKPGIGQATVARLGGYSSRMLAHDDVGAGPL